MSAAPPPLARALVLTDDGTMPYSAALVVFDGTIAGLTLATALITQHVLLASVAGAVAAIAPIHTTIAAYGQRLDTLGA